MSGAECKGKMDFKIISGVKFYFDPEIIFFEQSKTIQMDFSKAHKAHPWHGISLGNNVPEDSTPEDNTPEDNTPEDNTPGDTGATKFSVSKDRYNRISIKCLVTPIQAAKVEIRIPAWGNTITQNINSLNNIINYSLPAGKYDVKVSYGNPVKTEISKITID